MIDRVDGHIDDEWKEKIIDDVFSIEIRRCIKDL